MKLSSFATNLGLGPHNRVFFSVCELMCVGGGGSLLRAMKAN